MKQINQIKTLDDYKLEILFHGNETRIFDLKPLFNNNTVFDLLKDLNVFNSVVNKKYYIEWFNEIDLSADTLYLESQKISECSL